MGFDSGPSPLERVPNSAVRSVVKSTAAKSRTRSFESLRRGEIRGIATPRGDARVGSRGVGVGLGGATGAAKENLDATLAIAPKGGYEGADAPSPTARRRRGDAVPLLPVEGAPARLGPGAGVPNASTPRPTARRCPAAPISPAGTSWSASSTGRCSATAAHRGDDPPTCSPTPGGRRGRPASRRSSTACSPAR